MSSITHTHTHTGPSPEGGPEEHPLMETEEVTRNLRVCLIHLDKSRQALGAPHLCPADKVSCAWEGVARLGCQRRDALQPDSCKDTAHLFSTRPFPCGLPGWAGQTFCFSGVKNIVFPAQHVKNERAIFCSHCRFSCPTITCREIWRRAPLLYEPHSPTTANQD